MIGIRFWALSQRKRRLERFAEQAVLSEIYTEHHRHRRQARWFSLLAVLVTLCLTIVVLRPQIGFTWKESHRKGVDIVVAVDVSESMLATDVSPNRLERARRELIDLVDQLRGDRVSLVAFAGTAFIETPLTVDYGTFRLFLDTLSPDLVPIKGTNLQAALLKSIAAFGGAGKNQQETKVSNTNSRAIILITDGEDLEGDISDIKSLAERNRIQIYIIGVGTPEGSPIPIGGSYKKDKNGNVIVSRLNVSFLSELATLTGGIYVQSISTDDDTTTIYNKGIKRALEDSTIEGGRAKRWNEYFQIPLLFAIILLLIEASIRLRSTVLKKPSHNEGSDIEKKTLSAAAMVAVLFVSPLLMARTTLAESSESLGYRAKKSFEDGAFEEALKGFSDAEKGAQEDSRLHSGKGASLYRLQRYEHAKEEYLNAADETSDAKSRAESLYNAANSLVQLNQLEEAIKTYEESLKLAPDDKDAKENLEYAKRLLEQQQQQQQGKGEDKQQQQKDQQQDQQQQQSQNQEQQEKEQQQSQGGQQQQEEEKKEEEKKEEQKDQGQEKEQQEQQGQEQEQTEAQAGAGDEEQPDYSDQRETLLDGIEEGKSKLMKYRKKKALEDLEAQGQDIPSKDW